MIIFNIKEIRLKKKLTLYRLAKITGITRPYLHRLENNIDFNPTLDTLYRIAKALDVNIKDLFYTTLDIDNLKLQMYKKIDKYGLDSAEVMEISHVIDLLINIKMNENQKNK